MSTRRASQLTIAYASDWLQQSAWDVPLVNGDIDKAFPATSRNYVDIEETTEDIMDCTGQDFLFEIITSQFARLTIDFDVDPEILAGWLAFAFGVAEAPSGGTSEVQTVSITATGGTLSYIVQIGADAQMTAPIAYNANAAAVQAAIDALSNVAPGDITVGQAAGPPIVNTFTYGGALQKQDVNIIGVQTYALTGGTATPNTTTPGVGQTHEITRVTGVSLPLTTLYIGFRDSDKQPVIFKNVVVDTIRVRAASRGRVTGTVTLIGSADLDQAVGYTMPECTDIVPIRFGDCQMNLAGRDFIAESLGREFDWAYSNGVVPKFDGSGVYSTRHERADQRPTSLNYWVLGEMFDDVYEYGRQKLTLPASLRLGPTGRHVTLTVPQAYTKLVPVGDGIRFGGDPPESEVALLMRPKKVSGQATTPVTATAVTAQATTYMLPAA